MGEPTPIPDRLYFRIGEVAGIAGVKPYVLRYWESEFPMIAPQKSSTGQRVYRRIDVETVLLVKHLLYEERYSIEGAKKRIRELRKAGEWKNYRARKSTGSVSAAPAVEFSILDAVSVETSQTGRHPDSASIRARIEAGISALSLLAARPLQDLFKL